MQSIEGKTITNMIQHITNLYTSLPITLLVQVEYSNQSSVCVSVCVSVYVKTINLELNDL